MNLKREKNILANQISFSLSQSNEFSHNLNTIVAGLMIICLTYNTRLPNIWELSPKQSFVLCIAILYLSCIFVAFALCLHYNCIVAVSRLVAYKKNDSPCLEAIMGPQLTYYRLNVSLYNACMMKKLHAIDLLCNLDVISITAYFF